MQRRWYEFWADWGLVSRLMVAVGTAVIAGGVLQTGLLLYEGANETGRRLDREINEILQYLAPSVADQALVGDYAAIEQLLKKQVLRLEVTELWWTDAGGRTLSAKDSSARSTAPAWFGRMLNFQIAEDTAVDVVAGGVSYGKLHGRMFTVPAEDRLWKQFVKQLQILTATLLLMLQFLWLIFRGNLGALRNLASGANRFSQGDHAVRIPAEGAPEIRQAIDAFNNMATNTETLLTSLRQSESKNRLLASIVEQSSEAIWTADTQGVITSWNAGAHGMFGYTAQEATGQALHLSAGSTASQEAHMQRLLRLERFSYETRAQTKAGAQIDAQVAMAPLLGEDGQCVGAIQVARDVTERNRNEEALRAARAAAEAASLAKSAFLARMSHEIRTPMNGVLGMTELLLETELSGTQRKYAETVQRSGTNLLGIINDVLDFSKIEAGKLELEHIAFDLRRTIEDVVDMLSARAHSKGLEFACSIPARLPMALVGDPLRLGQVLTNLAGNAIKFTDKGYVLIGVRAMHESEHTVTLRFDVEDTGPGISREARERIFEEFSQADGSTTRQHGGSGLGLAISKQLVEMMQGNIHVESTVGVGATFWFTMVLDKQPAAEREKPAREDGGALAGVRVLIVEPSAFGRGILHTQVDGWGMSIRTAESFGEASQALQQAAARSVAIDMAIFDMGFGGEDPLALARSLKADPALATLRLVLLAPAGNHATARHAREAGFDACVIKPVRQSYLFDALVNVMDGGSYPDDDRARGGAASQAHASTATPCAVLLVEDNLVNQAVAMGMLNTLMHCTVTLARNGVEAVEAVERQAYDIILMDCHMPVMDGFEASRRIRLREAQSGRHVPIVALTANALAQDREDCLKAGMDDHLGKPFTRRQMGKLLERWAPHFGTVDARAAEAAVVAEVPAESVLDQRVLGQLRELQGKDAPDLLMQVLSLYLRDSSKQVARITQALDGGNADEARRYAHGLKSSSGNIGAAGLSELCAAVETSARAGDLAHAREAHAKLVPLHTRVVAAVEQEVAVLR